MMGTKRKKRLIVSKTQKLAKRDPTENVMSLVAASILRVDDLRNAEQIRINEKVDAESRRMNEQVELRAMFSDRLLEAEAKRLDAIRAIDANAVSIANDKASAQATVLATQVSNSAETLRALVATTAASTAAALQVLTAQLTDRIGLLEKNQYEHRGTGTGMRDMWGWIFGAIVGIASIGNVIYNALK